MAIVDKNEVLNLTAVADVYANESKSITINSNTNINANGDEQVTLNKTIFNKDDSNTTFILGTRLSEQDQ